MSSGAATVGETAPSLVSSAEHPEGAILAALLDCYLFNDLNPAEVGPLANRARSLSLRRGEPLYVPGDQAIAIYLVMRGQLREVLTTAEGREMTTELVTQGDVFGEAGVFARERDRIVSVIATEESHVIELHRRDVVPFLFAHPPAMHRLLEAMVSVVREEIEQWSLAHFASVQDRVAVKLAELAELRGTPHPNGTAIDMDLTQSLLASLIATTRPNVNQAIGGLIARGEVFKEGRRLIVRDPGALRTGVLASPRLIHRRNHRP